MGLGILTGICSSLFLELLYAVTKVRKNNSAFYLALPFFALAQYYLTLNLKAIDKSIVSIIQDFKSSKLFNTSLISTPYIFFASIATHLLGGSAGREGVGVLMGIGNTNIFKKSAIDNKTLIFCGITAGFSSIFGTPLAAIFFPFELLRTHPRKEKKIFLLAVLASFSSYYTTILLGTTHNFRYIDFIMSEKIFFLMLISIPACTAGAILFMKAQSYISFHFKKPLIIFSITLFLVLLVFYFNLYDYMGIGAGFIEGSFFNQRFLKDFFIKLFFTAVTIGVGLKGGEVTPLFFMGSSLINALNGFFKFASFSVSSALGMFSFFAASTLTPVTSSVMAYEYYGAKIALIVFPVAYLSSKMMRNRSVYN